jgi:AcrR family transcriptional regulator
MSRGLGNRNADYAETRDQLLRVLAQRLAEPDGATVSFRALAVAADVSVPTLRHYFGTRDGVLEAVFEHFRREGLVHLRHVSAGPTGTLDESMRELLEYTATGFRYGVNKIHVIGLNAGMGHAALGRAYLAELLEPTLQAVEIRLQRHINAGDMRACDVRHAALSLFCPLFMLLMHQHELGGDTYRPASVPAFITDHVSGFVAAYGTAPVGGVAS